MGGEEEKGERERERGKGIKIMVTSGAIDLIQHKKTIDLIYQNTHLG